MLSGFSGDATAKDAEVSQSAMGWLKAEMKNMWIMLVTADTSQSPIGWLNQVAHAEI
jgi:hypothetical protein